MIQQWLDNFHSAWKNHDIDAVLALFTDDVEYWETPHMLLRDKETIRKEWQAINRQENIGVVWDIYSSSTDNHHAVTWQLHYTKSGKTHNSSGVYLISLDSLGRCNYFYYVGKEK